MSSELIRQAFDDEADALVPASSDLWPAVRTRWAARQRSRTAGRLALRAFFLILTVFGLVLLASPRLRTAVAAVVQQLVGMSGGPGQPTIFSPTPPFTVWQSHELPAGWRLVAQRYATAGQRSTVEGVETGPPTELSGSDRVRQAIARERGEFAHIVLGYEGPDDQYVVLFERAAQAGEALPSGVAQSVHDEAATLLAQGEINTLVWISEGTWIELESSLPDRALWQFVSRLTVSQRPPSASASATPSGMVITSYEVPQVSLEGAQAQVNFHIPTFEWVPNGYVLGGAHVSPPDWANVYYVPTDPDLVAIHAGFGVSVQRGIETGTQSISGTERQPDILVHGQSVEYWSGLLVGALKWETDGFVYRLSYSGFELSREEVQRLAESLR